METQSLAGLYSFFEIRQFFLDTDSRNPFCLITLAGRQRPVTHGTAFVFFAHSIEELRDDHRRFTLSAGDIALLNPNTHTCPVFRSKRDAELAKAIYRRVPVLIKEGPPKENPWGITFLRMFDMANDSHLYHTRKQLETDGWGLDGNIFRKDDRVYLPLYEAKMIHHFDHRWATYDGLDIRNTTFCEKTEPTTVVLPRYWVAVPEMEARLADKWDRKWFLGWRKIARNDDERTFICTAFPRFGFSDSGILGLPSTTLEGTEIGLLGNMASMSFDYLVRQKLSGTNMAHFITQQLPIYSSSNYVKPAIWSCDESLLGWLIPRVLELTYTAWDLELFAKDCGYNGPPFRWDEERRFLLRCELDAAYFHLYGISRDDVDYIMETFPIVKRKDEQQYGEYRTERVILEIYDAMQRAIATGDPYQTRLDPPPADPRCCHPPREDAKA